MKKLTLVVIILCIVNYLSAQTVPTLSESDFIQKSEMKKKVGWIKIYLDDKFNEVGDITIAKHVIYDFSDKDGNYISTYSNKTAFPKNAFKVEYQAANDKYTGNVVDGVVTFFDKNGKKQLIYNFKDGFIIKIFEYNSEGGLKTAIEYVPKKESIELFANYYNKDGTAISSDSHESYDGYKYVTLKGSRDIN